MFAYNSRGTVLVKLSQSDKEHPFNFHKRCEIVPVVFVR